jgi:hypothetical protein
MVRIVRIHSEGDGVVDLGIVAIANGSSPFDSRATIGVSAGGTVAIIGLR